jgi:hypothetical protein
MRRKVWVLAIALPVLLLIGDTVYWHYVDSRLESGLRTWLQERRAAGWQVNVGPITSGGWPFSATVTAEKLGLRVAGPDFPDGARWATDRLTLRVGLYHPDNVEIIPEGTQTFQIADHPEITGSARTLRGILALEDNGTPRTASLLVRDFRAAVPNGSGAPAHLAIGLLQGSFDLPLSPQSTPLPVGFSLSAEAITLPRVVRWPLGANVSSLAIEGAIHGKLPLGAPGITQAATQWRDNGGSVAVHHLAVGWGPLGLSGNGTLALDQQLQPQGAGTSHIIGFGPALDAMAANGALSQSAATAAKAVLSLLASTSGEGEPTEVDVPLTLQSRTLSMRQVPLVRLPELDWPSS